MDTSAYSAHSTASCVSDTIANDAADELKRLSALLRARCAVPVTSSAESGQAKRALSPTTIEAERPRLRTASAQPQRRPHNGRQFETASTMRRSSPAPPAVASYARAPHRTATRQQTTSSTSAQQSVNSSRVLHTSTDSSNKSLLRGAPSEAAPSPQDLQRLFTKLQRSLKSSREMELLLTRQQSLLEEAQQQLRFLDKKNASGWK